MKEINCIIVDDEPLAHEILTDYIERVPFINLLQTFDDAFEALQFVNHQSVDLVFLDIQMPSLTGIQWLKSLRNRPEVIFTTAYDHYALESYELSALDYLMKPVPFDRFLQAVNKMQMKLKDKVKPLVSQKKGLSQFKGQEFIFIKTEYRIERVLLKEIQYVEGMKDYLSFRLVNGKLLSLMNFKQAEELLPERNFIRVHKSYIVALGKIESIERNRIRIGDQLIPIGDTYRDVFYERLKAEKLIL
ncbi:LytR/AlgR family response regulator transcription factor [Xanthovirga aplysinae]|uniref:LytR/AlgR family response regulator transcription factor n=1 Tax=Xanthovirga aplysinae TaxID=2529853 RepID=UPI0012BBC9F6|nr:LytTR family DNA-binding domain-containing protein [Xanthovirga aplysinae]MTI33510.1 response regulator transcription factor [Xanthovirga aplysinae]